MKKTILLLVLAFSTNVFSQTIIKQETKVTITPATPQPNYDYLKTTPPSEPSSIDNSMRVESDKMKLNTSTDNNTHTHDYDDLFEFQRITKGKPIYYTTSEANLRTEAGTNSPILLTIPAGYRVYIIQTSSVIAGWWYVYYAKEKQYGWIYKSLLLPDPEK